MRLIVILTSLLLWLNVNAQNSQKQDSVLKADSSKATQEQVKTDSNAIDTVRVDSTINLDSAKADTVKTDSLQKARVKPMITPKKTKPKVKKVTYYQPIIDPEFKRVHNALSDQFLATDAVIISFLIILFLLVIGLIVFWDKMSIFTIEQQRNNKLLEQMVKGYETIVQYLSDINMALMDRSASGGKSSSYSNSERLMNALHEIALYFANEINRMENNLRKVKDDAQFKPYRKSVERMRNFLSNLGYEIDQLLGQTYDERQFMEVLRFIDDSSLPKGQRIISKVIKPQVRYKNQIIQYAQVEVSQNI